ncbi:DUF779 domain-containing protein [Bosea sp. F3-2]|uniref:DUF779 domain-containing protein n=1 Tax=Bosea sp. F3-2 TaxID=2599640 RepID=UPI0032C093AF
MEEALERTSQELVDATPAARALLAEIIADHGPVLFHQSGRCCDGSSPMCYPEGDFIVGDRDVLLGKIGETSFYIGALQFEVWKRTASDASSRALTCAQSADTAVELVGRMEACGQDVTLAACTHCYRNRPSADVGDACSDGLAFRSPEASSFQHSNCSE